MLTCYHSRTASMVTKRILMNSMTTRDRYISFEGLDCDVNASKIVETLHHYIASPGNAQQWADYFKGKLVEKQRLGVDDLFFVGSQLNNIYAFFEEVSDSAGHELLYQVEQECC